jgi:hypothetical protein
MPVRICLDSLTSAHICSHLLTFVCISFDSLEFDRIFVVHDQYYYLVNSIANIDEALNP